MRQAHELLRKTSDCMLNRLLLNDGDNMLPGLLHKSGGLALNRQVKA